MDSQDYILSQIDNTHTDWLAQESESLGGPYVVNGEKLYDIREYPGILLSDTTEPLGFLIYHITDSSMEILFVKTIKKYKGIGSALLRKAEEIALEQGCSLIRVYTTNDNLDEFRFYQRRGFVVFSYEINSFRDTLALKGLDLDTRIIGQYGIASRDVIGLCKSPGRELD